MEIAHQPYKIFHQREIQTDINLKGYIPSATMLSATHLLVIMAAINGTMYSSPPVSSNMITTSDTAKYIFTYSEKLLAHCRVDCHLQGGNARCPLTIYTCTFPFRYTSIHLHFYYTHK